MLTFAQNIIILVLAMVVSLGFMAGLNRAWPIRQRYSGNDQVGWQLSVLGTTYAVILGFMLYNEWNNFRAAGLTVDLEASALRNVYRLAEGLPQPQRQQLEDLTQGYAKAAIAQDWPQMRAGRIPSGSHPYNERMWKVVLAAHAGGGTEAMAQEHALSELSVLTTHRRTRLLESTERLPSIFWAVLLVGGVLTTLSVSMFGSIGPKLHAFQVFSITLLVTLAMLAIADVGSPFRGWVHVSDYAFERALENMSELP
jgi:Protein of unknown function (DUF4239)